jgi:hypothetical protein
MTASEMIEYFESHKYMGNKIYTEFSLRDEKEDTYYLDLYSSPVRGICQEESDSAYYIKIDNDKSTGYDNDDLMIIYKWLTDLKNKNKNKQIKFIFFPESSKEKIIYEICRSYTSGFENEQGEFLIYSIGFSVKRSDNVDRI